MKEYKIVVIGALGISDMDVRYCYVSLSIRVEYGWAISSEVEKISGSCKCS